MAAEVIRNPDGSYTRTADDPQVGDGERDWGAAKDPTSSLWALVRSLRGKQNWRQNADELALQLYSDMRYVGYRASGAAYQLTDVIDSRVGTNVIRAIVRTLNSKVARRRSRPYVVTNGGSWVQRNTAENLEKWLLGKLRMTRADEELFPLFRLHALVFGTGCVRVFSTEAEGVQLEVIPPNEILVDDSEARYGKPPNIYFVRAVSKAKLRFLFPDKTDIIDKLSSQPNDGWLAGLGAWDKSQNSDVTMIIEAIRLPSGPDAGDGRHVIAVTGGCLLDEEWTRPHFNCAWMRGELRPQGFWGIGVPEDLAATQIEITSTALARQEIIEMLSNPYWLVERGMKVAKAAFSNLIGRVMEFTPTGDGRKPELVSSPAVPQDIWQHETALKQTAFETRGVSQLSSQMLKPQGLNSGKALRAYTELESELLSDLMNDYESALLRVCELMIEEQIDLAKRHPKGKHAVTHLADGEIEVIEWSDVGLENDLKGYIIEILPASALASTLSARIEDVYDMRDLGLLSDPDETWDYLNMPDRRRLQRKKLSPRKLLERVIEQRIVKLGEDVQPEPTWNLQLASDLTLNAIAELELYQDAPQDRLELLRLFLERCRMLLTAGMPTAPAPLPEEGMIDGSANLDPGLDPGLAGLPSELATAGGVAAPAPALGGDLGAAEAAAAGVV